jgi:UDP-glucose 4-epimerase
MAEKLDAYVQKHYHADVNAHDLLRIYEAAVHSSQQEGDGFMKVLVTGGAGFIGSHIADYLIDRKADTVIVDNLSASGRQHLNPRAKFYEMDICDPLLDGVFEAEKPDYVIHLAAQIDIQASLQNTMFDAKVNILGTMNLLQSCVKHRVRKIVYSSSAAVNGTPNYLGVDERHPAQPMSSDGISKMTPEFYIQCFSALYGLQYTILRYSNVYGTRQDPRGEAGVVAIFLHKLLRGEAPYIYGDGEQTRDFIYVKDVAAANYLALLRADREIINIACNRKTSVNELYHALRSLTGSQLLPVYKPGRRGEIMHSCMDSRKAYQLLKWEAKYTLYEGLGETIREMRDNQAGTHKRNNAIRAVGIYEQ